MNLNCGKCGKKIDGEGIAFCPYCGAKLLQEVQSPDSRNEEAEKWIQKAQSVASYPDRKKILLKGLEACPDSREIRWELLFIGNDAPKKSTRTIDYSIIKCWILELYRTPGDLSEEKRNSMRMELFDAPQLKACLALFDDPEEKQREYLLRLCRDYIEIFLEGSSQVMGRLFGFQLERNKEKRVAIPVAQMIGRILADEKLTQEQRNLLRDTMYQAYQIRMNGKTEHLDTALQL